MDASLAPCSTVAELIDRQATLAPQAVYCIDAESGQSLSFLSLQRACLALRAVFEQSGLKPGDTVSVVMPNSPVTLVCILGCLYNGLRVNPVNLLSQAEVLRYVLDHSDCRLVIGDAHWTERCATALQGLGRNVGQFTASADLFAQWITSSGGTEVIESPDANWPRPKPLSQGLLMYTSGTTGRPKGVMHSHAGLVANAYAISAEHGLTSKDRVTAVLPLYHINAFAVTMLAPLAHGGSLVMPAKFSAAKFWPMVIEHQCTWLNVVPTIISYLLEGEVPARERLRAIRFCRSASAALAPEHHRAFESTFGIGIIETMGLTETVAPCFSNPLEASQRKVGSVGRASGCQARIADAQGQTLPDGEIGEVLIQGPQVMLGYYKNEQATQDAFFPDRWLRSGDLGRRDADGFFTITGRIKELIIKGGENIAPREIDEAVLQHPAILEAAAVGIPDRHYGQEILLAVMLKPNVQLDEAGLRAFCTEKLGPYKTPKVIRFVEDLPRGPSGKVQRLKLVELA
jgi:acyl-CoA synthetase (AMP-forming)/AMP-acid ligase II